MMILVFFEDFGPFERNNGNSLRRLRDILQLVERLSSGVLFFLCVISLD